MNGFESISLAGDHLLAASATGGLHAFSIANPELPLPVGWLDSATYGSDVVASSEFVYVADYLEGLHVISVDDPSRPEEVGGFALPGLTSLDISGSTAYLCGPDGLVLVDVADPARPSEIGRVELSERAEAAAISGDYAYAVCPNDGLYVVSADEPSEAAVVASLPLDGRARDIAIEGDMAFVAADGIRVVSIADPLSPVLVARYESDQRAKSLSVDGARLCLGEGPFFRVFSIEEPESPALVGEQMMGLGPQVEAVSDYAVMGLEWRGVLVLDLTDLEDLPTVASLDTADRPGGVDVVEDLVYVADREGGLFVIRLVTEEP